MNMYVLYPRPECPFTPAGLATHTQPSYARTKVIALAILPSYYSPRNMLLLIFEPPGLLILCVSEQSRWNNMFLKAILEHETWKTLYKLVVTLSHFYSISLWDGYYCYFNFIDGKTGSQKSWVIYLRFGKWQKQDLRFVLSDSKAHIPNHKIFSLPVIFN